MGFDCGICNRWHECHCERMKSHCADCRPLSLPESDYQPVAGLTMAGKVAATAYRRRALPKKCLPGPTFWAGAGLFWAGWCPDLLMHNAHFVALRYAAPAMLPGA